MAQQDPEQQRELVLDIISAENLKHVAWFGQRMNPYAVAWVHHRDKSGDRPDGDCACDATSVVPSGGRHPRWNQKLHLTLTERQLQCLPDDYVLTIAVMHRSAYALGGRTRLGSVTVPVWELVAGLETAGVAMPRVSYQLRRPSGRRQGLVNFAVTLSPPLALLQETRREGLAQRNLNAENEVEARLTRATGVEHSKMRMAVYYAPVYSGDILRQVSFPRS